MQRNYPPGVKTPFPQKKTVKKKKKISHKKEKKKTN